MICATPADRRTASNIEATSVGVWSSTGVILRGELLGANVILSAQQSKGGLSRLSVSSKLFGNHTITGCARLTTEVNQLRCERKNG
jgi:hypothetical protein